MVTVKKFRVLSMSKPRIIMGEHAQVVTIEEIN